MAFSNDPKVDDISKDIDALHNSAICHWISFVMSVRVDEGEHIGVTKVPYNLRQGIRCRSPWVDGELLSASGGARTSQVAHGIYGGRF
jgi:hypothetical protein